MTAPRAAPGRTCPRCKTPLAEAAAECPRCLLEVAIAAGARAPETSAESAAASMPDERAAKSRTVPSLEDVRAAFPELEIVELVGSGGMGAVYRARQTKLARTVALKVLAPHMAATPGFEERFLREARALARLSHPGIVAVHDFGSSGGFTFLVMEFVEGVNLRRLLRDGPLAPQKTLAIVRELCDALQYAHDEGVVHRDIKPENVLLDAHGRVKVADFGLAKLVDAAAESALTRSDQVMGTPHYMAPEQLERPLDVDHRADIFALGVVLYEMLTGSLPRGAFEPPSRRVAVDVKLDEIVLRALEHEPARRYQHALEVKSDVEHLPRAPANAAPPAPTNEAAAGAKWRAGGALRTVIVFAVTWILLALAWNAGAFVFGLGVVLAAGAHLGIARAWLGVRPELWKELTSTPVSARRWRGVGAHALFALGIVMITGGHVLHWERGGGKLWDPAYRDGAAAMTALRGDPWSVLLLAAEPGSTALADVMPRDALPGVMFESFQSHASLSTPMAVAWLVIALGLAAVCLGFVQASYSYASNAQRKQSFDVALELTSYVLAALLLLWTGAPMVALRRTVTLDGVRTQIASELDVPAAIEALSGELEAQGASADFDARFAVRDQKSGTRLASGALLRFAHLSPFDSWTTSFSGPRRVAPQVWVKAVALAGDAGGRTRVVLDAGLYERNSEEHLRAQALLEELAGALRSP